MPRNDEIAARGVGIQVCSWEERRRRKGEAGWQKGRDGIGGTSILYCALKFDEVSVYRDQRFRNLDKCVCFKIS